MRLFLEGNQLPSPGMAFRKSVILSLLPLDAGLIQYSDWQLHLQLLYKNRISLLTAPLVRYRIFSGSTSAMRPDVEVREEIETKKLMDTVVDLIGNDVESFRRFFGENELIKNIEIYPETLPFWLGRMALNSKYENKKKWGYQTIMNFISDPQNMELLNRLYGFSYKQYMDLVPSCSSLFNSMNKIIKYKKREIKLRISLLFLILINFMLVIKVFLK